MRKGWRNTPALDNDRQMNVAAEQHLQFLTAWPMWTRHVRQAEACAVTFPQVTLGPSMDRSSQLNQVHFHRVLWVPEGNKVVPTWGLGGKQESHAQCS